jgi:hypothetical protein
MKYFLVALIAAFALSVHAAPKRPCKEGQTEADGCHVVKKAEKKPPAKKKPDEKKPGVKKPEVKK